MTDPRYAALIPFFEEQIPFNRLLGMRVADLAAGAATLRVPHHPTLVGDPFRPAIHGGVLSALADAAGGLAVFTAVGADDKVSTLDMRVDYLRPARTDQDLRAVASLLRMGNRVAVVEVRILQDDDSLVIARATAVYNIVRRTDTP